MMTLSLPFRLMYRAPPSSFTPSSGGSDGFGHSGPKNNTKTFDGVNEEGGARYISLNGKDKVIIVRPPPAFG